MVRTPADVARVPDPSWPALPLEILVELEQIEFRVTGAAARDARIGLLIAKAGRLRGEIERWVRCVRGGGGDAASADG